MTANSAAQLTRWRYQCGECLHHYDLPGVDLSFFYGSFLGVSPSREAVVFDTLSFPGFAEVGTIIDSLRDELPNEHPGNLTSKALSEVSDPDSQGWRYIFTGTPGCPVCASMNVADFTETAEPWPHPAQLDAATTEALERIDEYMAQPLLPANTRWALVTRLDRLRRLVLDDLEALL